MSDTIALPSRPDRRNGRAVEPNRETAGPLEHSRPPLAFDYAQVMRTVARTTGKNYGRQTWEMYRLKFAFGRIAPVEYFYYTNLR